MQEPSGTLLTTEEIAERLKIHVKTVREWIASGELKAFDLGQAYRVQEDDLQAFLNARKRIRPRRKKQKEKQTSQFKFTTKLVPWNGCDQSTKEQQP